MSEEEYSEEEYEEEEVEEEAEEAAPEHHEEQHTETHRRTQRMSENVGDENMNEGEKAMLAAKKRHEDDDNAKLQDYEEKRRTEREREEEELRILKEKQEKRRLEREEEEQQMAKLRQQAEELRQREEEERKARMEADRKKKEEEKMKRAQMMGGFAAQATGGGRNFTIPEKKDKGDKFGNIVQAKQEMGMTKEQQEEAKESFLSSIRKQIDIENVVSSDLKAKLKEMHVRICKLEAEKYDLEKRHERQTYDLRELNERSRTAKSHGHKKGADPVGDGRHPGKVAILNKYDRQIDRRNFSERRAMYEKKDAFPCFPNVPPPPTILEFKPKKEVRYDVYQNEEPEEEEEEYEEDEEE